MSEKKLTFEAALLRLEEIVGLLDSADAPLDKSLELFEEGAGLVKLCSSMLDNVEQRVKVLTQDEDGIMEEKDLGPIRE
ncbi:MAG: exodeoxyribonuclease VII small subunit [Ruminococcaceae bacterium]|nr:exodeoxyribonuclease VII small subunit [Oscillospiraceae bacterium]